MRNYGRIFPAKPTLPYKFYNGGHCDQISHVTQGRYRQHMDFVSLSIQICAAKVNRQTDARQKVKAQAQLELTAHI